MNPKRPDISGGNLPNIPQPPLPPPPIPGMGVPPLPPDPLIYSTMLASFLGERNPLRQMAGDLRRKFGSLFRLRKNLKRSKEQVAYLQEKFDRWQSVIESTEGQHPGTRLNKLR